MAIANLSEEQKKNIRPFKNSTPVREISLVTRREFIRERLIDVIVSEVKEAVPLSLQDEAMTIARKLAAGPTVGLALTKKLIQQAADHDLSAHLDAERDAQRQAGRTADYAEGVTAFLEKRKPNF